LIESTTQEQQMFSYSRQPMFVSFMESQESDQRWGAGGRRQKLGKGIDGCFIVFSCCTAPQNSARSIGRNSGVWPVSIKPWKGC